MGKPTGFLEYERKDAQIREPVERIRDFHEFKKPLPLEEQRIQGARCMECGVPFCQSGMMIAGMASGCPSTTWCRRPMIWSSAENGVRPMSAFRRRTASRSSHAGCARPFARRPAPAA